MSKNFKIWNLNDKENFISINGMPFTVGLETEIILCNTAGMPAFTHNGKKTSNYIIKTLVDQYGSKLSNCIKPELDSCQLELINPKPHKKIDDAIVEIQEALYLICNFIGNEGLFLSDNPYGNISNDIIYSDGVPRYKQIHDALIQRGIEVRNTTNIAGTHINIPTRNDFYEHINISKSVKAYLKNGDYGSLFMNPIRHKKYVQAVDALKTFLHSVDTIPVGISETLIHSSRLDQDKKPYQSYELVRLKRLASGTYISELRTIDGPTGKNPTQDFAQKTIAAFNSLVGPYV